MSITAAAMRTAEDLVDAGLRTLMERKDTKTAIASLALGLHEYRKLRVEVEREVRSWARGLMDTDSKLRERIDRAVVDALDGEPADAERIVQSFLADREEDTPGPDHYAALLRAVDQALAEEIPDARAQRQLEAAYPH